jgi:hypothetical protein
MSRPDRRWTMAHPAVTAAEQRLMTLLDDVGDMATRVLSNGPERHHAEEKLGFALERLAGALVLLGWSSSVAAPYGLGRRHRAGRMLVVVRRAAHQPALRWHGDSREEGEVHRRRDALVGVGLLSPRGPFRAGRVASGGSGRSPTSRQGS